MNWQKKQRNKSIELFVDEKSAINVIMDCKTRSIHQFRARLGFKKIDLILTKEQPVLRNIFKRRKYANTI